MSISKWLARKGNVGGTARWAGNAYWSIRKRKSDVSIEEVMREIVSVRYRSGSMQPAREALLSIIEKGEMRGLAHLVVNILSIEANFRENSAENRFMFMDVVQEELEKLKIPNGEIYDVPKSKFMS